MGTDIHLAVEVRHNGTWQRALPPEDYPRSDFDQKWLATQHPYLRRVWYHDRNYRLFAILADVRNGFGFAGVKTGEPVTPIAPPRGLPTDLSSEVIQLLEGFNEDDIDLGDHSFSWLTLAELQGHDWAQETIVSGVVSLAEFVQRVAEHGRTSPLKVATHPYANWCGGISGRNIVTLTFKDALMQLDRGLAAPHNLEVYVQDHWAISLTSFTNEWTTRVMPALAKLGPPEDVRIVFGFDS